MIINNPNQQGSSNILMNLLQMFGNKEGDAGFGNDGLFSILNLLQPGGGENQWDKIFNQASWGDLNPRTKKPWLPQDEWSDLPPNAF